MGLLISSAGVWVRPSVLAHVAVGLYSNDSGDVDGRLPNRAGRPARGERHPGLHFRRHRPRRPQHAVQRRSPPQGPGDCPIQADTQHGRRHGKV